MRTRSDEKMQLESMDIMSGTLHVKKSSLSPLIIENNSIGYDVDKEYWNKIIELIK